MKKWSFNTGFVEMTEDEIREVFLSSEDAKPSLEQRVDDLEVMNNVLLGVDA